MMEMKKSKKIVVYVDLDNTIANFQSGVDTFPAAIRAQYGKDENGKDHSDEIPGLFSKMKEIDGAKEGFQFLADHFDTYILSTAPWNNPSAWCDKLEWVKAHLGPAVKKRLILSHHKDLLRGDYIIDDNTNNGVADFPRRPYSFRFARVSKLAGSHRIFPAPFMRKDKWGLKSIYPLCNLTRF